MSVVLRSPEPGDLGRIVQRHGVLYAAEEGWDHRFEGVVAGIARAREVGYAEMVL